MYISDEHRIQVKTAEEFILDQRILAAEMPDAAKWNPEEGVAVGFASDLPIDAIEATRDSSRAFRKRVEIEPVPNPALVRVQKCLGSTAILIDPEGPLDQPNAVVQIRVKNERTFNRFWKRVGINLDLPKDATSEEIGLTTVSGMEFDAVRAALRTIHERDYLKKHHTYRLYPYVNR